MVCTGLLLGLSACGGAIQAPAEGADGATESETTRTVTGQVPASDVIATVSMSKGASTAIACVADAIHATDVTGVTVNAYVESDCRFQLDLPIGKTYALSLSRGDVFVATLLFSAEDGLSSTTLHLPDGEALSLGELLIAGPNAFPEFEPVSIAAEESPESGRSEENDPAEGEMSDSDEAEDVVSGSDEVEATADDDNALQLSSSEPRLIRITPLSGARNVASETALVVQASCALDPAALNGSIFTVGDAEGGHVECRVTLGDTPDEVRCAHDGLLSEADYIVTVEGLSCAPDAEQHGSVRSMTWHFQTE